MALPASAYRTIFDDDPEGLVILSPDTGRIRECNSRFAALAESDRETLRDREITAFVTIPGTEAAVTDRLQTGDGRTATWRIRTDSDGTRTVAVRFSSVTIEGADCVLARVTDTADTTREPTLERKAQAIESAPIGITMTDPHREDNPLVYVNGEFQRQTGYSEAEVLGRNCRFLQGEGTAAEPVAELRAAIEAEKPVTTELRNYRKDGSLFWNRITVAPVRADDGTLTNFVGFQEDITERKQYEQELELADHLIETVPSGILRTTPDNTPIEYANPALVSLVGADSVEQLREYRVTDFYADPSERAELIDALDGADTPVQREIVLKTVDGEEKDVLVTASRTEDETGQTYINKVLQDITRRKQYERQLREQRDNLDILNQMLRHDIRNDLQLVTAYANILEDHVDETGSKYLHTIQTSAANAVELTETAREMADVMLSTKANRQEVALRSALEGELDAVRSEHPDAAITVAGTIPDTTVAADEMLDSVFRNLLTNAIQHNDKAVPEVAVTITENEERITVRIADNGPGIPDDHKAEIFGKGQKGLESDGTGIGLYLVETLVKSYGGSVRIEDNEPTGAVFVVELPLTD